MTELCSLAGKRVLVTGAGGFIGSHLTSRLIELSASVHAVTRTPVGSEAAGAHWWQADLSRYDEVESLIRKTEPQVVFHLASHVYGGRQLDLVLPTFRSNLATTVNLMTAAAETSCERFLLTGSLEEPDADAPQLVPSSPYAAAKWAASAYGRMFNVLYGLPVVMLRVFMVYGPGQRDLKKLIPSTTLAFLKGETPRIASGSRPVDWIFVDDVVEAILKAAVSEGAAGETLEIGSGRLVTVREIVELVSELVGNGGTAEFGSLPPRPMEQVRVADVASTKDRIGWSPAVELREGLTKTIQWCRSLHEGGANLVEKDVVSSRPV